MLYNKDMHNNRRNSGFVSTIILLIIAFVILKYKFNFDVLDWVFKYINKETLKSFDDKVIHYFNIAWQFIRDIFINNIKPLFN